MKYFIGIRSLAELKKEYRRLAMQNHPDRGGDTKVMQDIIRQFEILYDRMKDSPESITTDTGYESDFAGASAHQYSEYVYNEYRWTGSNYKGQSPEEVVDLLRQWLKNTYPRYKFSVNRKHYDSIYINLISADFEPFLAASRFKVSKQINQFNIESDPDLTDRAKEVFMNVYQFVNSYNFDDSDLMTDYHHRNFYLHLEVGKFDKPYKIELPKLASKKGDEPKFKHPEGQVHKAIRQALGKDKFQVYNSAGKGSIIVLGYDYHSDDGEVTFFRRSYSSAKQAQKRIDKLAAAGIRSQIRGYNGGYIEFLGYTEQTETALEQERAEYSSAYEKWKQTKKD